MASRSMNKAILIGNLTRDPELKYTPNGTAVCTFGVATNRSWTTTDGQIKEDTQFHRVVAWQKLAELCGKLLTKGKKIYMEGRITYRSFTGKDGQQRSITEIVLDDFIMFDSGKRPVPAEGTVPGAVVPSRADVPAVSEPPSQTPVAHTDHTETVNPEDIPF
jgi:single-strand DNA-binding protein